VSDEAPLTTGAAAAPRARGEPGIFVTGSTMKHVVTMTATGSIGLVAVFIVDALNLFYISLLGQQELAAAIGYAGTLLFFSTSIAHRTVDRSNRADSTRAWPR